MSTATINILCTGGTFDKAYGTGVGVRNFLFPEVSSVEVVVRRLGLRNVRVHYDQSEAKDSLDMTDSNRAFIAHQSSNEFAGSPLVIVHGTDTMIKTAEAISSYGTKNAIVLTGALQPACVRDSDAEFNLGGAIIAAQVCPPGIYIAMSGTVFPWDKCHKNELTGCFEWK